MTSRLFTATMLLATTCLTMPALAETAGGTADADTTPPETSSAHDNVLQEIVVTSARARNENAQETPLAITAVSQELLERDHVTNFDQLGQLAPNIQIFHNLGTSGVADVYMRGFGENSNDPSVEPHVATLIDGVYQPDTVGNLFDMWDVCNVDVEGGPQGTLLGKNASIGGISINRCLPENDFKGEVQADYGSYDHVGARAWLNLPIWQDAVGDSILAARLVGSYKEGGNWVYNMANGKRDMGGENEKTGRIALAFTPTPEFRWDLIAGLDLNRQPQPGQHQDNNEPAYAGTSSSATQGKGLAGLGTLFFGGPVPNYAYGTEDDYFTDRSKSDGTNVSSNMSYKLDPITLTSVTGFVDYWLDDNLDDTGTPFAGLSAFHDVTSYDYESEEFRINSNKNGGWDLDGLIDWVVGGYYSNFNYKNSNNLGILNYGNFSTNYLKPGTVNVAQRQTGNSQSEAAFAHVIFNFTDQWTGTFGIRQSWDQKAHSFQGANGTFPNTGPIVSDIPIGFHNTSVEVGTAYQFDSDHLAYIRFAQGYQAGGTGGMASGQEYHPELNNEYEAGYKADWLNKRLRTNFTFFINELSQLQVESALSTPTPPGFVQEILNAGSATVEGFESEIVALPVENLTTHLNVGYLHTKYNQNHSTTCSNGFLAADCSGLPFSDAPKWTLNLGADYVIDLPDAVGTATLSADWDYRSTLYNTDPVYPSSKQEGYGLLNAGVKFEDPTGNYAIEFFGTNILNRRYEVAFTDPSAGAPTLGIGAWQEQGRPAEWGVRVTVKFGPFRSEEPPAAVPAAPPETPTAPPAPIAKAPEAARQFQVFFDFDKSDITSAASQVIEAAAEAVKAGNVVKLTVTGHTDTVGSAKYNQALSERRAAAVKGQLVTDGVASSEITATGVGKTGLLVPTADGVREPQNRRAEIVLQ